MNQTEWATAVNVAGPLLLCATELPLWKSSQTIPSSSGSITPCFHVTSDFTSPKGNRALGFYRP